MTGAAPTHCCASWPTPAECTCAATRAAPRSGEGQGQAAPAVFECYMCACTSLLPWKHAFTCRCCALPWPPLLPSPCCSMLCTCPWPRSITLLLSVVHPTCHPRSTLTGIADERVRALFLIDPVDVTVYAPLGPGVAAGLAGQLGWVVGETAGALCVTFQVASSSRTWLDVRTCAAKLHVPSLAHPAKHPRPRPPADYPSATAGLEALGRQGRSLPLAVVGSGLGGDCVPPGGRGGRAAVKHCLAFILASWAFHTI